MYIAVELAVDLAGQFKSMMCRQLAFLHQKDNCLTCQATKSVFIHLCALVPLSEIRCNFQVVDPNSLHPPSKKHMNCDKTLQ